MAKYEHDKNTVLRHALHCAIRDREGMLDSLRSPIHNFEDQPREQALAQMLEGDREYYLEIESWLRDFRKLLATTGK